MSKHYFLSRFQGSGSTPDPFRALVADLGPCSILDLRPNQTRVDGWCFASVKQSVAEPTSFEIYLGDDPDTPLPKDTIDRIKVALGIDFQSTNLTEILAEILLFRRMPGRGLRPGIDGSYRIYLGKLLWEATEAEVYEFLGRLQEPDIFKAFPNISSAPKNDLRPALREALRIIEDIVDRGQSGWLLSELEKVKSSRSCHPLAVNYSIAEALLHQQDFKQLHGSSSALWILMLAHDLEVTHPQLNDDHLGSRLCDPNDCEPTKYELYVMARYLESGSQIEKTDSHGTGEFRIRQSGGIVHIECKYKSKNSMGPRRVKEVFEVGTKQLGLLLEKASEKLQVQIDCRTDPTLDDLPSLLDSLRQALEHGVGSTGVQIQNGGKFQISLVQSEAIGAEGAQIPAGMDYATSGPSIVKADSDGVLRPTVTWSIAWRVANPSGWTRSVVNTVRQAAAQVPSDTPNLVYVHVPPGRLGVVHALMDSVFEEIDHLLSNPQRHTRVNAVILTGRADIESDTIPKTITTRYVYKTILHKSPRFSLPAGFKIFGRDITRSSLRQ
jgi:hypothetical protein